MLSFKHAILSLFLVVPMLGTASTITKFQSINSPSSPSVPKLTQYSDTGGTTVETTSGFFTDYWELNVGSNETASIAFNYLGDVSPNGVDIYKILNFGVHSFELSQSPSFVFNNISTGTYTFSVQGKTTGQFGGLYAVGTVASSVSSVPLPAAVWLFGTVLFGFLSISKHRNQL